MVETIHTAVKGRARYKVSGLYRSESLKKHIEIELENEQGVRYVSASPLTGNVLVVFNSDRTPNHIASLIEAVVSQHGNGNREVSLARISPPSHIEEREKARTLRETRKLVKGAEEQESEPWHLLDAESVLAKYKSSKFSGLSSDAAGRNLNKYGPNLLPESIPPSGWSIFIDQFKSLPVALLSVAAGLSVATGGIADAVVIMGVVAINATIGYVTESQSEKTIQSLKGSVRPYATAVRDARSAEIKAEDVVPGDILVLKPGSYVAADARLIESDRLQIDESALTGESMPVMKSAEIVVSPHEIPLADRTNMVFMGTLVTGGGGLAVVVATGRFTQMGQIQLLVGETRAPETPMEKQLEKMGNQLVLICTGVCGLVFFIGLLRGYGVMAMLQSSLSLAVAAVPEGLPAVATTTLALGIQEMRRRRVLIRHLEAVETLGSVQTLCLDKTGTITLNQMSVVAIYAGMHRVEISEDRLLVDGNRIEPADHEELLRLMQVGVLCTESEVTIEGGEYTVKGSSTENALFRLAMKSGIDLESLMKSYPVVKMSQRSDKRNYMVTLHTSDVEGRFLAVKGNPDEVLAMCRRQMRDGAIIPLGDEDIARLQAENERMAGNALRVLAMAYCEVDGAADGFASEEGFIWLGLVGMADPIRKGVEELIATFHQAGIDTVMITGDQTLTADAIGKKLKLNREGELEILDSTRLAEIEPEVMEALAKRVHVFARVSPAHKLQIVQALQKAGKVVAMTGDGINDSPALKAADIGIAMGQNGTAVAREVADVVLEQDDLQTMAGAISQGRTIYSNIRKAIHFLLATNFSEIIVMSVAMAGGLGQPLNARQLLWINLISDIFPGLALAMEQPEPDVLNRNPRDPGEPIIKTSDFRRITFESSTLAAASLGAYGYGIARYGMGMQAGTIGFMSLAFAQLLHALSCRSEQHSLFGREKLPPNPYLNVALGTSLGFQALTILVPGLRSFLGLAPIGLLDAAVIGGSALLPLAVNEATKGGGR
jgi:Ca2+-transporting ATPase